MTIAPDLKALLPKASKEHPHAHKPDPRPVYYAWVFDPQTTKVHVEHGQNKHPAHFPTHETMAQHVTHPDRQEGYAYSILGGWRITDADHKKLDDPFIIKRVIAALREEHPPPPLPSIRYHGNPRT